MARSIRKNQDYKSKLLKLIPTEIVAAYMALNGIFLGQKIIMGEKDITFFVGWGVFFVLLLLTPIYLSKIHDVKSRTQRILTTFSFVVWVYTLGGPFAFTGLYHPQLAACVLVLWTLVVPLCVPQPAGVAGASGG